MWPFTKREKIEQRAYSLETDSVRLNDVLLSAWLSKGVIDVEKAMNVPAFAGCVNRICDTVSIIPIRLYKRDGESVETLDKDPRVRLLNDDTRDTLTGSDFKRAMVFDYLTNKGGYAYINKSGGRWVSLHYVEADKVSFTESVDPIMKDYKIMVNGRIYEGYRFLKLLRRTKNGYRGVSAIDEYQDALRIGYNTLLFENNMLKRGGNKKGFLQSDHKLSQDAVNTLKEAFTKLYSDDKENAIVLNDGVKFQEASNTAVETQLAENKKQNSLEICKLFAIPPAILSGGASERDWLSFIQYCILPIMDAFTTSLNRDFLLEKEKATHFFAPDVTELTKGDIKTRFEAWGVAIKNGFMQVDEVRQKENLESLEMPFLKLGLQDVLYDPETGGIYTPNTGLWGSIRNQSGADSKDAQAPTTPAPARNPQSERLRKGGATNEGKVTQ